jgi:hypothetical protein
MELEFVPLLQVQRDLYGLPRGMERFRAYLRTMVDPNTGDLELPLVAMNPMGKEHVPALLDRLLELQADDVGDAAVASVREQLRDEPGRFRVGLVVADDARGGWTNRYTTEFSHRFEGVALYKRGWVVGLLWSSETPAQTTIREEILTAIHRAAHIQRHGAAKSLSSMLAQEGVAMAMAGCVEPRLDPDDLTYTRQVLEPLLDATDRATVMACLFGDDVANTLGYRPQGLSHRAGLALALHQARSNQRLLRNSPSVRWSPVEG